MFSKQKYSMNSLDDFSSMFEVVGIGLGIALIVLAVCGLVYFIYFYIFTATVDIDFVQPAYNMDLSDVSITAVNVDKPSKSYTAKYKSKSESCTLRVRKDRKYQFSASYNNNEVVFFCSDIPGMSGFRRSYDYQYHLTIDASVLAMSYIILDVAAGDGTELNIEDITVYGEDGETCGSTVENGQIFIPYVNDDEIEPMESLEFFVSANGYKNKTVDVDVNGDETAVVQVILEEK